MKEEQLKILKAINEATKRTTMAEFSQKVNLPSEQIPTQIRELANNGFLKRDGNKFCISEKGKTTLKFFATLPEDKGFCFFYGIDRPTGFEAKTIAEFYQLIKEVSTESLEFHLYREDFEKWTTEVLQERELALEIINLKNAELKSETLRKALQNIFETKYNIN